MAPSWSTSDSPSIGKSHDGCVPTGGMAHCMRSGSNNFRHFIGIAAWINATLKPNNVPDQHFPSFRPLLSGCGYAQ